MTPAEHRKTVAAIMGGAPANDSDIITKVRPTDRPRHGYLADEFRELLEWRRLANPQPVWPSAWLHAENDNEPPGSGQASDYAERAPPNVDAEWEMRPTVEEYMTAMPAGIRRRGGEIVSITTATGWVAAKDEPGTPYGADPETAEDRRASIEALKDVLLTIAGSWPEPEERFAPADHFGMTVSGKRQAARNLLAEIGVDAGVPFAKARASAGLPPAANDNRPAFPHEPYDLREIFWSYNCASKPSARKAGEFAQAALDRMVDAEEAAFLRGKLPADTVRILDTALVAENFRQIGETAGYRGKTAERQGKTLLLDAVAELRKVLASRKAA